MNRRLAFVVAIAAALAGGLFAAPRRYEVEGVSMGPALLPGDIVATGWLPDLDRWRPPERFDRWLVTLPDGTTGLKRVVGLPGERVAFEAGDLTVAGRTELKGPRLLAALGAAVETPPAETPAAAWSLPPATVLDDAPFAAGEVSRRLLPVRDAGFAAEVEAAAGARVKAAAGPLAVTWRLIRPGRYAVVAGRLDGHAVAAAWRLPEGRAEGRADRSCLPPLPPNAWDVARPWPVPESLPPGGEERSPALSLAVAGGDPPAVIIRIAAWRDVLFRPAASGHAAWSLAAGEVFALGDFPSGSRDSRHFGPLPLTALRHRIR